MRNKSPIAVIGSGSWGTALAILLARNGQETRLWGKDNLQDMAKTRENRQYLPGVQLPKNILVTEDIAVALENVTDVFINVPSHAFRSVLTMMREKLSPEARIAWGTKGIDPESDTLLHEVVLQILARPVAMAVISGPSFAKEVAIGLPTAVVLASNDAIFAQDMINRLHSNQFRVYTQNDMIGVQICGAVKNGLAVGTGISDGLSLGANARAALITRGLSEMARLGLAMGANRETFMGLAGLGDLVLTCTDEQSRNRRFGFAIGKGVDIETAQRNIGQIVEGRQNAIKVFELAQRLEIDMPIIEQVCRVLRQEVSPAKAVETLLSREQRHEEIL